MKSKIVFSLILTGAIFLAVNSGNMAFSQTIQNEQDTVKSVYYTCPMHPEIIQDMPGKCPKCGMDLVKKEYTTEYTCPMHPEVISDTPGKCPKCGMNLVKMEQNSTYTCPMHPEVIRDQPGKCPVCGMNLVKVENHEIHHMHDSIRKKDHH